MRWIDLFFYSVWHLLKITALRLLISCHIDSQCDNQADSKSCGWCACRCIIQTHHPKTTWDGFNWFLHCLHFLKGNTTSQLPIQSTLQIFKTKLPRICQRYARDMPEICTKYSKHMPPRPPPPPKKCRIIFLNTPHYIDDMFPLSSSKWKLFRNVTRQLLVPSCVSLTFMQHF